MLFISPEVTQLMKLMHGQDLHELLKEIRVFDKHFVFFALNNNETTKAGGSHWSLLVLSRPESTFYHYDSSNKSNLYNCEQFVRGMKAALKTADFKIRSPKCLQQNNCYDCGIHVLSMADKIGEFVNHIETVDGFEGIDVEEVSNKRQEILAIISSLGGVV
ncbi:SENP8 family protein [Megaselia abdita]